MLPLSDIVADPDNVRDSEGDVDELAASMKAGGLLQPIIVYPISRTKYKAWAGHRRLKAAHKLGWETIDAVIRRPPDTESARIVLMMTENMQRRDLNPIEEAKSYKRLMDQGLTMPQIAERLGKKPTSTGTISTRLDLLEYLTEDEQRRVANKEVALSKAADLIYQRKYERGENRADMGEAHASDGYAGTPHFTRAHPQAAAAHERCNTLGHTVLVRFGGACGPCWETAIRRDERLRLPSAATGSVGSRAHTLARMRCKRCEGDGTLRGQPCRPPDGRTYAQHDFELVRSDTDERSEGDDPQPAAGA